MFFSVYSNCVPVKGYTRSIICDLQRNRFDFIPNTLFDILTDKTTMTIDAVKNKYEHKHDETIDEYFDFLFSNEYVFLTNNPERYPSLNTQWYYPFPISNAIIDIDVQSPPVTKSLKWLEAYLCKNVQIRFYRHSSTSEIADICKYLQDRKSDVQFLQIILPFTKDWEDRYNSFYVSYPRLSNLTFYNAPFDDFIKPVYENRGYTLFTTKKISSCMDCGVIDIKRFAVNIQNFTEALQFNTCLNRKIAIDIQGVIKNCPSMQRSFGTIDTTSIQEVLTNEHFDALWNIKKDDIEKCRDCEFRYICIDCRAYLENPDNIYSKPLKCGYDPYSGIMEDWKVGELKEQAGKSYKLSEFSYDV